MRSLTALVRRPGPKLADGIVTHIERVPLDYDLACRQWQQYVDAMVAAGWEVVEVPPADECADAVFVEDTVVVYRNTAVIARPGADARRPEIVDVEETVESLGCSVHSIGPPGTLDGGDVLKVGDTIYVGRGGRTNADGIEQLRAIVEPIGATVIAVPVHRVLHLKSAVTALPDGSIIGWEPAVDDTGAFPRFVPVAEESGAHVVLLGGDKLLMAAGCPRTADSFAAMGYEPIVVDISEFEKLEGCVTCLSVRLRDLPAPAN